MLPDEPAQLVSPQGDVSVDLEAGSISTRAQLPYETVEPAAIPQLPSGYVAVPKAFDLSVIGGEEPLTGPYSFIKPVTITVRLSPETWPWPAAWSPG